MLQVLHIHFDTVDLVQMRAATNYSFNYLRHPVEFHDTQSSLMFHTDLRVPVTHQEMQRCVEKCSEEETKIGFLNVLWRREYIQHDLEGTQSEFG